MARRGPGEAAGRGPGMAGLRRGRRRRDRGHQQVGRFDHRDQQRRSRRCLRALLAPVRGQGRHRRLAAQPVQGRQEAGQGSGRSGRPDRQGSRPAVDRDQHQRHGHRPRHRLHPRHGGRLRPARRGRGRRSPRHGSSGRSEHLRQSRPDLRGRRGPRRAGRCGIRDDGPGRRPVGADRHGPPGRLQPGRGRQRGEDGIADRRGAGAALPRHVLAGAPRGPAAVLAAQPADPAVRRAQGQGPAGPGRAGRCGRRRHVHGADGPVAPRRAPPRRLPHAPVLLPCGRVLRPQLGLDAGRARPARRRRCGLRRCRRHASGLPRTGTRGPGAAREGGPLDAGVGRRARRCHAGHGPALRPRPHIRRSRPHRGGRRHLPPPGLLGGPQRRAGGHRTRRRRSTDRAAALRWLLRHRRDREP